MLLLLVFNGLTIWLFILPKLDVEGSNPFARFVETLVGLSITRAHLCGCKGGVIHLSLTAGLYFYDFISCGINLVLAGENRKIYCEKTALMRGKLGDTAETALNRSVAGKAGSRFEACYITVLVGHRVFPECEER